MATNHLNLFALDHGLTHYKGRYYGVYKTYNVCIGYEGSNIVYFINTQIEESEIFQRLLEQNATEYDIVLFRITPPIVSIVSRSKNIKMVLDYITALLKMCSATSTEICSVCGEELGPKPTFFDVDGVVCVAHERCFNKFNYAVNKKALDAKYSEVPTSKIFGIPALTQFAFFVLIIVLYIATSSRSWFFYIFGGFLMGYSSALAYVKKRGKSGLPFYASLLSLSAVLMFLAQAIMHAYMIIGSFNFFIGLSIFFYSWTNPVALTEMLLPQLAIGMAAVLVGLLLIDYYRIRYIKTNTVRITRIVR